MTPPSHPTSTSRSISLHTLSKAMDNFNIPIPERSVSKDMENSNIPSPERSLSKDMENFNIPSPERVASLERLQDAMGDAPPYFWAACQVCDLKALEKLVELACTHLAAALIVAGQCQNMSRYWSAHPGELLQHSTPKKPTPVPSGPPAKRQRISGSSASMVVSSPPLARNKTTRSLAEQRDKSSCVLTGEPAIQLAHIYPFHSIKHKEEDSFGARHMFWNLLKVFWPEERVADWQAELFPAGINETGLEQVSNLITLSANAHLLWDRGAFALKPISVSNDNKTLKVQFFWQKKQQGIQATTSLLTTPFSTEELDHNQGSYDHSNARLMNSYRTDIKSGDLFELQTDDPDTMPLPSFKLLEMQWFLQRVVGMAGAAGSYDADLEDDSSNYEEMDDMGLDRVGDYVEQWIKDSDKDVSNLGLDGGDTSQVSTDPSLKTRPNN